MNRSLPISALLALGATACVEGESLADAQLLVPDDVVLHWDHAFNGEDDGLGAVVPIDVMVYAAESGEPLVDAELLIQSGDHGTQVIEVDGVLAVEPENCADCNILWDAWRDRYVELDPIAHDDDALVLHTDDDGLARVYLIVDNLPVEDVADFESVPVLVSMGISEATFHIVPQ